MFNFFKKYSNKRKKKEIVYDSNTLPYKSIRKIGDYVVCITSDNKLLNIIDDGKILDKIKPGISLKDLELLFINTNDKKIEELLEFDILRQFNDFIVDQKNVYLKGTSLPIPEIIVNEFINICEERINKDTKVLKLKYSSLINFWLQLANSSLNNKENILSFIKECDIQITPLGNMIVYRRCNRIPFSDSIEEELFKYVMLQKDKLLKNKQSLKSFNVWYSKSKNIYKIKHISKDFCKDKNTILIGTISNIINDLLNRATYTSFHNSGKYTFNIPGLYKVDDSENIADGQFCNYGSGLHSAGRTSYNFSGYGDTLIAAILSPYKATLIPINSEGKIRSSEMYTCKILKNNDEVVNYKDIKHIDELYFKMTVQELKDVLCSKNINKLSVTNKDSNITLTDLNNIVNILNKRIIKIK